MFGRPLPLTLTQKGLLLVVIPLIVELLVISTLSGLLTEAEAKNRDFIRGRAIFAQTTRVSELINDAVIALTAYNNTKHDPFIDRYDKSVDQIPVEVTRLARELGPVYSNKASFNEFKNTVQSALAVLSQTRDSVESGRPDVALFKANNTYSHILNLTQKLKQQADLLYMQAGVTSAVDANAPSEAPIKTWLIGGIVVNVLLAVGLAFFFNRSIARRINVVRDNAFKYARGEAPSPSSTEADELSDLDTGMRKMAEALLEASRRERQVIEYAGEVICTLGEGGMIELISPSAERLWLTPQDDLLGRRLIDLIDIGQRPAVQAAFDEAKGFTAPVTFEAAVVRPSSENLDMQWSVTWSSANRTMFCVAHDVSERKKVEKLKQDLIQMVSHDLRSPLTSLSFYLSFVEMGMQEEDKISIQKKAGHMRLEVSRLIALINNLLDLEKLTAGKLQLDRNIVDISTIVDKAVNGLSPLADARGVNLKRDTTSALVDADEDKLVQCIGNFLSNAIKFSPKQSVVGIAVTVTEHAVRVSVTDSGPGIDVDDQDKLFNQFEQISVKGQRHSAGSGLGLAITKQIVEMHGGEVGVISTAGSGSTFWFTLPRMSDPED